LGFPRSAVVKDWGEFKSGWPTLIGAACGVGAGTTGSIVYAAGIFLNPVSRNFGWSRGEISAGSLFTVAGLILAGPIVGFLADRVGVRKVGMISLALLALALFAMTRINAEIWTYYAGLFFISVAGGGTTPIVWARGVASWFDRHRGFALALMLLGTGAAGVLTPLFVGGLIEKYGWQGGYLGLAAAALVAIIPVFVFFREKAAISRSSVERTGGEGFSIGNAIRGRHFWQIALAFAFIAPVVSALLVHLVALLIDTGIARPTALQIAGFLGLAVIAGRLLIGFLVDRFPPPLVAGAIFVLPAAGCLLAALYPGSLPIMILATISFGFGAGAEIDLLAFLVSRYFGLRHYSAIYGLQFAFFEVGVGFGPWLTGRSYDATGNYREALFFGAAMFLSGAAVLVTLGAPGQVSVRPRSLAADTMDSSL
jgi:MFS family permease